MSRQTRSDDAGDVTTEQVLKSHEVPWESFTSLRLISDRDAQLIRKYDKRKRETQAELLEQVLKCLLTFLLTLTLNDCLLCMS